MKGRLLYNIMKSGDKMFFLNVFFPEGKGPELVPQNWVAEEKEDFELPIQVDSLDNGGFMWKEYI